MLLCVGLRCLWFGGNKMLQRSRCDIFTPWLLLLLWLTEYQRAENETHLEELTKHPTDFLSVSIQLQMFNTSKWKMYLCCCLKVNFWHPWWDVLVCFFHADNKRTKHVLWSRRLQQQLLVNVGSWKAGLDLQPAGSGYRKSQLPFLDVFTSTCHPPLSVDFPFGGNWISNLMGETNLSVESPWSLQSLLFNCFLSGRWFDSGPWHL